MMKAQTSDMMICPSEGGLLRSARQFTAEASAEAASCQGGGRNSPPEDRQIIMSEVRVSIIDFVSISVVR